MLSKECLSRLTEALALAAEPIDGELDGVAWAQIGGAGKAEGDARVIPVVQPDADDLAGVGDRRADPQTVRRQLGQFPRRNRRASPSTPFAAKKAPSMSEATEDRSNSWPSSAQTAGRSSPDAPKRNNFTGQLPCHGFIGGTSHPSALFNHRRYEARTTLDAGRPPDNGDIGCMCLSRGQTRCFQ